MEFKSFDVGIDKKVITAEIQKFKASYKLFLEHQLKLQHVSQLYEALGKDKPYKDYIQRLLKKLNYESYEIYDSVEILYQVKENDSIDKLISKPLHSFEMFNVLVNQYCKRVSVEIKEINKLKLLLQKRRTERDNIMKKYFGDKGNKFVKSLDFVPDFYSFCQDMRIPQ